MNEQLPPISVDLKSFSICSWCLRVIPILLAEGYFLFLLSRQLLKTRRYYDSVDKAIFLITIICIGNGIFSILFLQVAVTSLSYVLKVIWTLSLYLVFLRFLFKQLFCSKLYLVSIFTLAFIYFLVILFCRIIPVRYTLLAIYLAIGTCAFHQILSIREFLNMEKAKRKELKKILQKKSSQIQMELLDNKKQVNIKILPQPFKYHILLRKSFCISIVISLALNYFFLWDLQQSRNSIGQFFTIVICELLVPGVYFFFTSGNQWIIEQLSQRKNSERQVSDIMRDQQI